MGRRPLILPGAESRIAHRLSIEKKFLHGDSATGCFSNPWIHPISDYSFLPAFAYDTRSTLLYDCSAGWTRAPRNRDGGLKNPHVSLKNILPIMLHAEAGAQLRGGLS